MSWANLIVKFFRLGPLGLGLIAVAILGAGYFLQVQSNQNEIEKAVALQAGPPAAVNIAAFDAARDAGALDEVVINAQPVLDYAYRLTIEKDGPDSHVFMVPLIATTATTDTNILGIAYFPSPTEDFANITPELLMAGVSGLGSFGPVISYNGELDGMGSWRELTEESFFDEGLVMPDNPVVVWPYMNGREAALAPRGADDLTIFGILSKLAGIIGIIALAKIAFPSKREDEAEAPAAPQSEPSQSQSNGAYAEPARPVASTAASVGYDDLTPAPRRKIGLRGILTGIVGAAFVVLLAGVALDMMNDPPAAPVAVAEAAAVTEQAATPTADDETTPLGALMVKVMDVVNWGMIKLDEAANGDPMSIAMIGLLGVVVMLVLFVLRNKLANSKGPGGGLFSRALDDVGFE